MQWELLFTCFNGPRVYRKYGDSSVQVSQYNSNFLEDHCGFMVGLIETCWTVAMYTSPFLVVSAAYRRSVMGMSPEFALKFALGVAFVYGGAYLGRGLGRAMNKDYMQFLHVLLSTSERNDNVRIANNNLRNLRKYDFDFRYWPVNYRWREMDKYGENVPSRKYLPSAADELPSNWGRLTKKIFEGLSFVAAHTVARRLAYPGTLALLQKMLSPALEQGRTKLVQQMKGQRFKLETRTGAHIDSMLVDRRNNQQFPNGNTLVITCEGNAGFYEAGSATTPLEAKYSVLMWNHPGFGGSTGVPWPSEEAAAVDVVVQFALNQLGWEESEIIIYGWSIGGYTSTWAAMNYRNIRALILDATFDDVVPLAVNTMPRSWSPLVTHTVRTYLNLHIEKQLVQYDGPVVLVRRSRDEVMSSSADTPPSDLAVMRKVNRANNLLKSLLSFRYPNVFRDDVEEAVDQWLGATVEERTAILSLHGVDADEWRETLQGYIQQVDEVGLIFLGWEQVFPLLIGDGYDLQTREKLALYLASKYLVDFDSTHCTPLPAASFFVPVHPWE